MKLKKKAVLGICAMVSAGILSSGLASAAVNYSVINNYGGAQLGYSPDSGVKILNVGGYYFKDMNRNGRLDRYEDWRLSPQQRAEDLAAQISIDQIAGLMLYSMHQRKMTPELNDEQRKMLGVDNIRTVLNADTSASAALTAQWNNALQAYAESLPFAIPANTSSDPRNDARGNGVYLKTAEDNVSRWPSNLGLAATFDPEIVRDFAATYAKEYRLLGIGTGLSPQIDLATDPRWTRNYGTFGEDPALARDMARASIYGAQETIKNGVDTGWGEYSINAMMKHFPGDGVGEGGREAHSRYGKYAVYPGGAFQTQLIPFEAAMNNGGAAGMPSAVMMSYSIAWSDDGSLGEKVGSAYSKYKIDLLRNRYNYDGVICTDWCVTWDTDKRLSMAWGVENISEVERHYRALMAGVDQFGGNNDKQPVLDAYRMGVREHGESFMNRRFRESAVRLLRNIFQLGLFENPYLDVEKSAREVGNADDLRRGYEAQLKSIVMLKNTNGIIHQATYYSKPTVYIPMVYRKATEVKPFNSYTPASWSLPVNLDVVQEYFNVVTDRIGTFSGVDRDGKPMAMPEDIIRLEPERVNQCDMVLAFISNPIPAGNQFDGIGYDAKEGYIPISLQYGNYVADSPAVRRHSIAGDPGENRSYYGKTAQIINPLDSESVNYSRECVNSSERTIPVIAVIAADKPMIFSEIEPAADAILVGYGVSDRAFCDIITGKFEPQGLLPMQQPRDMITVEEQFEDVPRDMVCYTDSEGNTYDFAFGLNWRGVINDSRTAKYNVPAIIR
ncbi:MAG: glycoside hydrolase family 3 C-terminal domain-containing protein [Selenomonadaceae bacterium]|nr:glycoside hydrolase family 3 C-terminal domain-containing protein [Selenomonadaceae bacterium]